MGIKGEGIEKLWAIIDKLRGDNGCPWDKKQTPDSVKTYVVEEAHEVYAAIRSGDPSEIAEELGDLLFMVLFMIHLYEEEGIFNFQQVCLGIEEKMIRRHPHVFGNLQVSSPEEVKDNWEKIKRKEKRGGQREVPGTLPSLLRAYRMLSRNVIHPSVEDEEEKLMTHIENDLRALLSCSEEDFSRYFADVLIRLCQLARIKGFRAEDVLQERLDERELSRGNNGTRSFRI